MSSPALLQPPASNPRVETCEMDIRVTRPTGPLAAPERLLAVMRTEVLTALPDVLEGQPYRDLALHVPIIEVDLGQWPDEPVWSDVRYVLVQKLRAALAPYLPPPEGAARTNPSPLDLLDDPRDVLQFAPQGPGVTRRAADAREADADDAAAMPEDALGPDGKVAKRAPAHPAVLDDQGPRHRDGATWTDAGKSGDASEAHNISDRVETGTPSNLSPGKNDVGQNIDKSVAVQSPRETTDRKTVHLRSGPAPAEHAARALVRGPRYRLPQARVLANLRSLAARALSTSHGLTIPDMRALARMPVEVQQLAVLGALRDTRHVHPLALKRLLEHLPRLAGYQEKAPEEWAALLRSLSPKRRAALATALARARPGTAHLHDQEVHTAQSRVPTDLLAPVPFPDALHGSGVDNALHDAQRAAASSIQLLRLLERLRPVGTGDALSWLREAQSEWPDLIKTAADVLRETGGALLQIIGDRQQDLPPGLQHVELQLVQALIFGGLPKEQARRRAGLLLARLLVLPETAHDLMGLRRNNPRASGGEPVTDHLPEAPEVEENIARGQDFVDAPAAPGGEHLVRPDLDLFRPDSPSQQPEVSGSAFRDETTSGSPPHQTDAAEDTDRSADLSLDPVISALAARLGIPDPTDAAVGLRRAWRGDPVSFALALRSIAQPDQRKVVCDMLALDLTFLLAPGQVVALRHIWPTLRDALQPALAVLDRQAARALLDGLATSRTPPFDLTEAKDFPAAALVEAIGRLLDDDARSTTTLRDDLVASGAVVRAEGPTTRDLVALISGGRVARIRALWRQDPETLGHVIADLPEPDAIALRNALFAQRSEVAAQPTNPLISRATVIESILVELADGPRGTDPTFAAPTITEDHVTPDQQRLIQSARATGLQAQWVKAPEAMRQVLDALDASDLTRLLARLLPADGLTLREHLTSLAMDEPHPTAALRDLIRDLLDRHAVSTDVGQLARDAGVSDQERTEKSPVRQGELQDVPFVPLDPVQLRHLWQTEQGFVQSLLALYPVSELAQLAQSLAPPQAAQLRAGLAALADRAKAPARALRAAIEALLAQTAIDLDALSTLAEADDVTVAPGTETLPDADDASFLGRDDERQVAQQPDPTVARPVATTDPLQVLLNALSKPSQMARATDGLNDQPSAMSILDVVALAILGSGAEELMPAMRLILRAWPELSHDVPHEEMDTDLPQPLSARPDAPPYEIDQMRSLRSEDPTRPPRDMSTTGASTPDAPSSGVGVRPMAWDNLLKSLLSRVLTNDGKATFGTLVNDAYAEREPDPARRDMALRVVAARLSAPLARVDPKVRETARRIIEQMRAAGENDAKPPAPPETVAPETEYTVTEASGLVLLHPFLRLLLERLELLRPDGELDPSALPMAYAVLMGLIGQPAPDPLYHVLLGQPEGSETPEPVPLEQPQLDLVDSLLRAVIGQWGKLGKTSPDGLRETFLSRSGILRFDAQGAHLSVAPGPFDMLLDGLPWSISPVALPWMPLPCHVQWRDRDD